MGAWAVQTWVRVGQPKLPQREGLFLPPGGTLISRGGILSTPFLLLKPYLLLPQGDGLSEDSGMGGLSKLRGTH